MAKGKEAPATLDCADAVICCFVSYRGSVFACFLRRLAKGEPLPVAKQWPLTQAA